MITREKIENLIKTDSNIIDLFNDNYLKFYEYLNNKYNFLEEDIDISRNIIYNILHNIKDSKIIDEPRTEKEVSEIFDNQADTIIEHICKIVVFHNNTDSYNTWLNTLAAAFQILSQKTIGGKRLSKDKMELNLITHVCGNISDIREHLIDSYEQVTKDTCKEEYINKYISDVTDIYQNCIKTDMINLLSEKTKHSVSEIKPVLDKFLNKYNIKD